MNGSTIPVIVLATSKAWLSAIEREFPTTMLIWALDENDLLTEAGQYPDSAIIVECGSAPDVATAKWLKLVLEHRRRCHFRIKPVTYINQTPQRISSPAQPIARTADRIRASVANVTATF